MEFRKTPVGDVFCTLKFDISADDNGGGSSIGAARLPPAVAFTFCFGAFFHLIDRCNFNLF